MWAVFELLIKTLTSQVALAVLNLFFLFLNLEPAYQRK